MNDNPTNISLVFVSTAAQQTICTQNLFFSLSTTSLQKYLHRIKELSNSLEVQLHLASDFLLQAIVDKD
jgi:hypothetical protein